MSNTETRGWIFRRGTTNVAGIDGRGTFVTSVNTSTHLKGLTGESVAINMTSGAGYLMLARIKSTDGRFNLGVYNHSFDFIYGADTVTSNTYTHAIALLNQNGVSALKYLIVDGANHLNSTESAPATGAKLRPGSTSYFIGDMILKGNLLPETDVTYDLGNTTYRWRDIYSHTLRLQGATNATMTYSTTNPRIVFAEGTGTQSVALTYTDYDSYRASKGLKIHDADNSDNSNVWLEVQGNIYTPKVQINGTNHTYNLYVNGSTLHNGTIYLANGTTYYIDNSAVAYLNDLRVDNTRLVDNWLGFYQSGNAGGSRYAYIQGAQGIMNFYLENYPSTTSPTFKFSGHLVPWSHKTYDIGTSALRWRTGYFNTSILIGDTSYTATTSGAAGTYIQQGCIEMSASTPYIDFHRSNNTGDYTGRIIADAVARLHFVYGGTAENITYNSRARAFNLYNQGSLYSSGDVETAGYFLNNVSAAGNGYYLYGNNKEFGRWYISNIGPANTQGYVYMILGNATASTAVNNARGVVRLYSTNANYTDIISQGNGNRNFVLPNYAGDMYAIHAGNNNAVGGGEQPTYAAANGRITATSYALKATVNSGTATYMAYYSDARNISQTSIARIVDKCLQIHAENGSYREGIRIYAYSSWATIVLGGNDLSAASGTSANSWSIHNNNGNFYLSRNGSSSSSTASFQCVSNVWYFYTGSNGYKMSIDANHTIVVSRSAASNPYAGSAIEIREVGLVTTSQSSLAYAPKLGMHWGGRYSAFIAMHEHIFKFLADGGGSYRPLRFAGGNSYDTLNIMAGNVNETTRIAARTDGWIYLYNSGNGLYWPNCNGAHLYANSGQSTYGALVTQGARNGYNGLHFGNNTNYMTVMDNNNDKGLYQEGKRWILWYNRGSDVCCIMGSRNSGWRINLNENTYCYGVFYSGDIRGNKVRLVDDWVGYYQNANAGGSRYGFIQCNVNRMYFRKENGAQNNISFDFAGHAVNTGEWMSTANNGLRCRRVILRDDGSNFYLLVGTNGAPGDNWNSLRPFYFNTSNGYSYHTRAYQAVWNDYAEFRQGATTEPGRVVIEHKSGTMQLCQERLAAGGRIISDTYGNAIGETKQAQTPIAVSGRVLVYPYKDRSEYPLGAAVCAAPNGTVDIMTREEIMMYPDRIIGTVSEIPDYEIWHCGGSVELGPSEEVKVNGRIWVYVR